MSKGLISSKCMHWTAYLKAFAFTGVGSGFKLKMNNSLDLHLITLYTASRKERESRSQAERLQRSGLLEQGGRGGENENSSSKEQFEVRQAIKDLCHTIHGFIFVTDSSLKNESGMYDLGVWVILVMYILNNIAPNQTLAALYMHTVINHTPCNLNAEYFYAK